MYNLRKKYYCIDLFKFLAAFLIASIHISPVISYGVFPDFLLRNYFARIAVPYFFVASGFFLFQKISLRDFDKTIFTAYAKKILKFYVIWSVIYLPWNLKNRIFPLEKNFVLEMLDLIREILFVGYGQFWYLHATIVAVLLIMLCFKFRLPLQITFFISFCLYLIGLVPQSYTGLLDLIRNAPFLWNALKVVQGIMTTTRNGIFDGFFFMTLGALFSKMPHIRISLKKAVVGFFCSMILLLVEALFLNAIHWSKDYNMYLFLIPATYFLFCISIQIDLKESTIYPTLRVLSFLIFSLHTFINPFISTGMELFFHNDCSALRYVGTMTVTILASVLILQLSRTKKFSWLKNLYQ